MTVTGVTTVPLSEAQYYVPRCVDGSGGNCNLDKVNKKVGAIVKHLHLQLAEGRVALT